MSETVKFGVHRYHIMCADALECRVVYSIRRDKSPETLASSVFEIAPLLKRNEPNAGLGGAAACSVMVKEKAVPVQIVDRELP